MPLLWSTGSPPRFYGTVSEANLSGILSASNTEWEKGDLCLESLELSDNPVRPNGLFEASIRMAVCWLTRSEARLRKMNRHVGIGPAA